MAMRRASSSGTVNYLYDGANVLEEVDAAGTLVARYTQSLDIDEPLAMLRSSTTSYYEADGLGSVTSLTNSSGVLANTYTYDSFGKLTESSGTITNPYRYTGREWDSETNLYYYRARYYDSALGRFNSEDPVGLKAGLNFYTYAGNNPQRWSDPTGKYVMGTFDRATGKLTVIDLETGEEITIAAESGGEPFGEPIPPGSYDILERNGLPEFRLDKQDSTPYDDVDDATGRTHFRLHRPGRTIGCIAAKNPDDWSRLYRLIEDTPTVGAVPDNFRPWWKFWGEQEYVIRYGTLLVK